MQIVWHGGERFSLRGSKTRVESVPRAFDTGGSGPIQGTRLRISALRSGGGSDGHADQEMFEIDGPGEYEVREAFVVGVDTTRAKTRSGPRVEGETIGDPAGDANAEVNADIDPDLQAGPAGSAEGGATLYAISLDGVTVGFAGEGVRIPTREALEALGPIDVLLVAPAAGAKDGGDAVPEMVALLDPAVVVPLVGDGTDPNPTAMVRKMGGDAAALEPLEKLEISHAQLPEETSIVLLAARGTS